MVLKNDDNSGEKIFLGYSSYIFHLILHKYEPFQLSASHYFERLGLLFSKSTFKFS